MKNFKRIFAGILAVSAVLSAYSCDDNTTEEQSAPETEVAETEAASTTENKTASINGQTIVWVSDYNLNPYQGEERSSALAMFEDTYGCKIDYIKADPTEKFATVSKRLTAGEPVDMLPFDTNSIPDGMSKAFYKPLDEYFDILGYGEEDGIWSGMESTVEMFKYKDAHYVMPYSLSNPQFLIYSRELIKDNKLSDPYELYQKGRWDWNEMSNIMKKFVENAEPDEPRYGIGGWFGQAAVQSTGMPVVFNNNGVMMNNLNAPELERAENYIKKIADDNLWNNDLMASYPDDESTMFFAAGEWALGVSNGRNDDADLMVVPFPKAPKAENNYITCDFNAKMLCSKSDKGEAVAAYIKCERLAAINEDFKAAAKAAATEKIETVSGYSKSFITEEQYDAIQSFINPENATPVFDFGYGMGEAMFGEGLFTAETRGVMNNIEQLLLEGGTEDVSSWKELKAKVNATVEAEVQKYNN